jgi:hypothetical protein
MPFPLTPEGSTLRDRALLELSLTREQLSLAPQITPQLRAISRTLKRAGQSKTIRKQKAVDISHDSTNQITIKVQVEDQHASPYGPGLDIATSWPHYLASSDHADAKKVLQAYFGLQASLRRTLPIEAFCVAASVSPLTILGILTGEIVRMGAQASSIIAAVNSPRVVQKSVEMALTDDGIEDRTLLAKATGFLPSPKGSQTNIHVQTNASAAATAAPQIAVVAPPPEQTIRRVVDRFNDARTLPATPMRELPAAEPPTLPDRMPYEDSIAVEVEDDEEEE